MSKAKVAFNNAGCIGNDKDISNIIENLSTSTNNALILGLLERRIDEIYQFNTQSVKINENSTPFTNAAKIKLSRNKEVRTNIDATPLPHGNIICSYLETVKMKLNEFDVIFIRGDDIESNQDIVEAYSEVDNPLFLNSPEGTLAAQDKFEIKERAEKMSIKIPQTYNATTFQELLDALNKIPGRCKVIKARYGFGGKQVWKIHSHTSKERLWKIFEQCEDGAVVQKFKPIIENGDLRLNVFDGEVIGNGAILRRARAGRWQTNIDLGGSQQPYKLDKRIKAIAKKVSEAYPELRLHGIDLFLDGTFIETNAYPSTIGYTQRHFGVRARDIILNEIDELPHR